MPDDAGEKTESPTPRRRQEARKKGQVSKSSDLNSAVLLLGGLLGLKYFGPMLLASLYNTMRDNLGNSEPGSAAFDLRKFGPELGMMLLGAIGPIMIVIVLAALVSNLLQVGLLYSPEAIAPKFDKLNPINGVTRMFSSRTVVQLVMNLIKLAVVVTVASYAVQTRLDEILLAMSLSGWTMLAQLCTVLYEIGLQLAIALLVLALIDFAWQRYKFEKDLRMSKQEVREEMRSMDGDPLLKQRRRKMQMAAAMQRIQKAVPNADVIVTNPTELAIAIKYDAEKMAAPRVVAKGADHLARKIREIAMLHGIPIVERKPLAQTLYKTVEVGQEVPEKFYKTIAEVLAYVYRLSGKKMNKRSAA